MHVNRNGNAYCPDNVQLITHTLADIGYDCSLVDKPHLSVVDGMPVSALVGRREIMRDFDDKQVFHSCTFSGETTGLAAAMACLQYMRDNDVPKRI